MLNAISLVDEFFLSLFSLKYGRNESFIRGSNNKRRMLVNTSKNEDNTKAREDVMAITVIWLLINVPFSISRKRKREQRVNTGFNPVLKFGAAGKICSQVKTENRKTCEPGFSLKPNLREKVSPVSTRRPRSSNQYLVYVDWPKVFIL